MRTPLIRGDRTIETERKGKVITDRYSFAVPAWFVVGGIVAGAVALWVTGLGLAPTTKTKTIHVPGQGYHAPTSMDREHYFPPYWDVPPHDETVTVSTVQLVERPRLLLPFTSGTGGSGSGGTGLPFFNLFPWL